MTEPIVYSSTTANHDLPLLVSGQVQKEYFVNEALSRIDTLLHAVVKGERAAPPPDPAPGECWIVGAPAEDLWSGREHELAVWDGTQWSFASPREGQLVYDRATGHRRCFDRAWKQQPLPASPTGGSVADLEARAVIDGILSVLRTVKIGGV